MNLEEVMQQNTFVVVGDTISSEKYACKIKDKLEDCSYTAYGVGKELTSINDVPENIDIIDLCINPAKGLAYLKELEKDFKCIVIQPGAESDELIEYLKENGMPFIQGCVLVGLRMYGKNV